METQLNETPEEKASRLLEAELAARRLTKKSKDAARYRAFKNVELAVRPHHQ
jgi:hypothetical protein